MTVLKSLNGWGWIWITREGLTWSQGRRQSHIVAYSESLFIKTFQLFYVRPSAIFAFMCDWSHIVSNQKTVPFSPISWILMHQSFSAFLYGTECNFRVYLGQFHFAFMWNGFISSVSYRLKSKDSSTSFHIVNPYSSRLSSFFMWNQVRFSRLYGTISHRLKSEDGCIRVHIMNPYLSRLSSFFICTRMQFSCLYAPVAYR